MYRNINDFINDWALEVESTVKVFSAINDEVSHKKVHPDVRTLMRQAWHLTETLPEMGLKAGLFTENLLEGKPEPENMASLIEIYKNYANQLVKAAHSKWTDSVLEETIEMYGDSWTKGKTLQVFILHQAHHRGQITVVMRLLGLAVPGVYGPSKEDWMSYGMEVPV